MIKSELFRFLRNAKNRIILFILFIYPLIFVTSIYFQSNSYMETQSELHMNQSRIANIRALTLERGSDDDFLKDRKELIVFLKEISRNELSAGKFYKSDVEKNYHFINTSMKKVYLLYLDALDKGLITEQIISELGYTQTDLSVKAFYTKYLEENVEKLILNVYEINGANGVKLFFSGENILILMLILVLLLSDIYIKDLIEGSYKQIYTLSFSRWNIFKAKWIVAVIVFLAIVFYAVIMIFLLTTVIGGIGDFEYPVISKVFDLNLIEFENSDFHIISIWQYIAYGILQLIVGAIALITFVIYSSIRLNSLNNAVGVGFISLLIVFLINSIMPEYSYMRAIYPFSYLYIDNILNINTYVNGAFGFVSNCTIIIGTLVLCYFNLVKLDLNGIMKD